ncbi:hypothetical protein DFR58_11524 [Anaerobacterium chartisolvens]|uniref:Uncharacterized protein n=1 Tax=Anaerobacterium chartisolvens TaxID=1297424 RepID=A0A369AYS8_9FIRM|nr:hypothetical protein [Anaerobacterium chartisolvens]RCX14301.1 hypothetical protein DFR58_11524 [Anaerobacterium chartisolvens]
MIIPLKLAGLALTGSILSPKLIEGAFGFKGRGRNTSRPMPLSMDMSALPSSLHSLFKNLSASVSRIMQRPVKEDYSSLAKRFIHKNAQILTPAYPFGVGKFHLADIDGDSRNELIIPYRLDDAVRLLVLKKSEHEWFRADEISFPGHKSINFMNFAHVTGSTGKQMLVGFKMDKDLGSLHAYSFDEGKVRELFASSYSRIEVIEPQKSTLPSAKAQLAIWNKLNEGDYDIELMQWDGMSLSPSKNHASYYHQRVVPYYMRKIRAYPSEALNWYCFADALSKSGMHREAMEAIQFAIFRHTSPSIKQRLLELQERISIDR